MKKTLLFVAMATLAVCSCGASRTATQTTTQTTTTTTTTVQPVPSKGVSSGPEGKVREWQADGYKIDGTRTMYDKLVAHYAKLDANDSLVEVEGTATGTEKADARMYCLNDAAISYASAAKSIIEGGISRQFSNFTESGIKLMGAYTQKVQSAIVPFLKESVAVYRDATKNGKPVIEYDIYYIVDENSAAKVRKDAIDQALRETATEQIFGTAVDEWVKQFVRPTEQ